MSPLIKNLAGVTLFLYVAGQAFSWMLQPSSFEWPLFLVWFIMIILLLGFVGPSRSK